MCYGFQLTFLADLSKTGEFLIDEAILKEGGITDMEQYACVPGSPLLPDFFLDEADPDVVMKAEEEAVSLLTFFE